MEFPKSLKTLGQFALDLVFPISCIICATDGEFLCAACAPKLERIPNQLCIVCKKPAAFGKTHPDCVSRNTADGVISALAYTNPDVQKLISTFKYQFIDALGQPLAEALAEAIKNNGLENYFSEFTIIPVPLHKRRYNWRGFNQAEILSGALAKNLNISLDLNIISRSKFTEPQTTLTAEQRKTNIENAFEASRPMTGKFLLIDDVVTTGSTLNEIAKLLKKNGAQEVWAATIAHG